MYSNLTKTNYEIKDMSLQELRDRIITENNLTPLDILKGFHAKSKVYMEYPSCLTEQNLKDIELIQKEYEDFISNECTNNLQQMFDEKFNSSMDDYKKECSEFDLQSIQKYQKKELLKSSVSLYNTCFKFVRNISTIEKSIQSEIRNNARNHVEQFIKENFGETYKISGSDTYSYVGLPRYLDVNSDLNIDFSEVYEVCNRRDSCFTDSISFEYNSYIEDTPSKIRFYKFDTPGIFVHLSNDKAKEVFDNAINAIIYNNNTVGEIEFFQNLEAQPITINVNTKTNKYELIDGYKRLLFITDKELLNHTAPVRIFTDLNDEEFLTLLYASNVWKCEKDFHDRGFLFALKTRFGFTIPSSFYDKYSKNELELIQLYDFGGNLARVDKTRMMNTLKNHKHIAKDMKLMYNFLVSESKKCKFDENMSNEIVLAIVEIVGELRRLSNGEPQGELTEELITSIFEDDTIQGLCSKKHLSTRTYVINYFRDKGIYKLISSIIKDSIYN